MEKKEAGKKEFMVPSIPRQTSEIVKREIMDHFDRELKRSTQIVKQ